MSVRCRPCVHSLHRPQPQAKPPLCLSKTTRLDSLPGRSPTVFAQINVSYQNVKATRKTATWLCFTTIKIQWLAEMQHCEWLWHVLLLRNVHGIIWCWSLFMECNFLSQKFFTYLRMDCKWSWCCHKGQNLEQLLLTYIGVPRQPDLGKSYISRKGNEARREDASAMPAQCRSRRCVVLYALK